MNVGRDDRDDRNDAADRRHNAPFPGLRPFQTEEYDLFFGREVQTAELLGLLRNHHFIAVVGTSGSGKSSLVRAGLIPALHGGTMTQAGSSWEIAVMPYGQSTPTRLAAATYHGVQSPPLIAESGSWILASVTLPATVECPVEVVMDWKALLAYISGSVDEELLRRNEYLVTETPCCQKKSSGLAVVV